MWKSTASDVLSLRQLQRPSGVHAAPVVLPELLPVLSQLRRSQREAQQERRWVQEKNPPNVHVLTENVLFYFIVFTELFSFLGGEHIKKLI